MNRFLTNPAVKSFVSRSIRATVALGVSFATNEEFRKSVSDKMIQATLEANKDIYKTQIVNPQLFAIRLAVRNVANMIEMYTVYDLDEVSNPLIRSQLEMTLNLTAQATGLSVADILNLKDEQGYTPILCTRIQMAFANTFEQEDSAVSKLFKACGEYYANIMEAGSPSSEQLENLMNPRFDFSHAGLRLKHDYTDAEVSSFDDQCDAPVL